jgi:hypothetical protein
MIEGLGFKVLRISGSVLKVVEVFINGSGLQGSGLRVN